MRVELNNINGYCELIKKNVKADELTDYVEIILESCKEIILKLEETFN